MNFADLTLRVGSSITANIPYFRGLGTLYRRLNGVMMRLGAQPLVTARMKDGTTMLVDLRTYTQLDAYYRGEYDSSVIEIIRSLLPPDSVFMDIGANIGFYTISIGAFIRSRGGSGRVVAFEPLEANYQRLLDNLKVNNLSGFCSIHKLGLSNHAVDSLITLREDFLRGSNTGNAAIPTSEKFDAGFKKVPIRLDRLDKIWQEFYRHCGTIDVMKIDVEGHEDFCLEGGQQTIDAHRPTILMEVNKPYYDARAVKLDDRFLPLIPERYFIYRQADARWRRIGSLDECSTCDNIFLIPEEKSHLEGYRIFG